MLLFVLFLQDSKEFCLQSLGCLSPNTWGSFAAPVPVKAIPLPHTSVHFTGIMVMKAAVDDDASGWELNVPEKMEKSSTSWVDITQDFEDACRGEFEFWGLLVQSPGQDKVKPK